MSSVVILVLGAHDDLEPALLVEGAETVAVPAPNELAAHRDRLANATAVIAVTDGIHPDDAPDWAAALAELPGPVLEFRARPWNGEGAAAVAAVGRGLVAGFGPEALRRVVPLLARRSR